MMSGYLVWNVLSRDAKRDEELVDDCQRPASNREPISIMVAKGGLGGVRSSRSIAFGMLSRVKPEAATLKPRAWRSPAFTTCQARNEQFCGFKSMRARPPMRLVSFCRRARWRVQSTRR